MFSKVGTYEAVKLFSLTHIVSIFMCLLFVILAVFLTRKMEKKTYFKLVKIFAITLTVLEVIKIINSFVDKRFYVDAWVPLYFCSLFIYALWFALSRKNFIKEIGLSYIAIASIIAGVAFIIFPVTSFSWFPIFHIKCLHSMFYHSVMVYMGVMIYVTKIIKLDFKVVLKYCVFCLIFVSAALSLNIAFDGNLMFISNPGVVPIPFLKDIFAFSPVLYTILMILAHTILLALAVLGISKLVTHLKEKKENRLDLEEEELENRTI